MPTIGILIIDDHAMVREGLSMALTLQPDFEIIGQAENGLQGIALAERFEPNLVLLDLSMPDMDGITVSRRLRRNLPDTRILILTGLHDDERVIDAVEAGVDGYIVKDATTGELIEAIRHVARGHAYFHPLITQALVRQSASNVAPAEPQTPLTRRELDVLRLMITSATNRAIAAQLHVGEETVRTHVKNILRKLEQPNRTQAVLEGVRRGLITLT